MFWFVLIMDGSFGSGKADSSYWPWFTPYKVSVYLRDYAEGLYALRFQAMPASWESSSIYNARNGVKRDTRVGVWNKQWTHWVGRGAFSRQDNAPCLNMPLLRCTENCYYIVRIADVVAQYVNVS